MHRRGFSLILAAVWLVACGSASNWPATDRRSATVSGIVSIEGSPVPGVPVTLSAHQFHQTIVSGVGGHFRFDNVPAGHYTIHADHDDVQHWLIQTDLPPGTELHLDIRMVLEPIRGRARVT